MSRSSIASLLLVSALALAACSGGDAEPPKPAPTDDVVPSKLVPGTCLEPTGTTTVLGDGEIGEESVVDCASLHRYEVTLVQDVPSTYFADPASPTEADRVALQAAADGSPQDAVETEFAAFAQATCAIGLQRALRIDDLELAGSSVGELRATPISITSAPKALLPPVGWADQPLLVCVNRFTEPSADPSTAATRDITGAQTAANFSAETPVDQRSCVAIDSSNTVVATPCAGPHRAELLLRIDATRLLTPAQVDAASVDATAPFAREVQTRLDDACTDALSAIVGDDYDSDQFTGLALRGAAGWGRGGEFNEVTCAVTSTDPATQLPGGSVIGLGDGSIELVPAP